MNLEEEQTFSPFMARIFPRKQLKKERKSRNDSSGVTKTALMSIERGSSRDNAAWKFGCEGEGRKERLRNTGFYSLFSVWRDLSMCKRPVGKSSSAHEAERARENGQWIEIKVRG